MTVNEIQLSLSDELNDYLVDDKPDLLAPFFSHQVYYE